MIIVITGMPGSGKSTLASMLRRRRFRIVELSRIIKDKMRRARIRLTVLSLEEFAHQLKKTDPNLIAIAQEAALKVSRSGGDVAIVGVRCVPQVAAIKRKLGKSVSVIAVISPKATRYKRLSSKKSMRVENTRHFQIRDRNSTSQGALKLIRSADFVISNTGTKDEMRREVDVVLSSINSKNTHRGR